MPDVSRIQSAAVLFHTFASPSRGDLPAVDASAIHRVFVVALYKLHEKLLLQKEGGRNNEHCYENPIYRIIN